MGSRSQVYGVLAVADLHGSALMQHMRTCLLSACGVPVPERRKGKVCAALNFTQQLHALTRLRQGKPLCAIANSYASGASAEGTGLCDA